MHSRCGKGYELRNLYCQVVNTEKCGRNLNLHVNSSARLVYIGGIISVKRGEALFEIFDVYDTSFLSGHKKLNPNDRFASVHVVCDYD